MSGGQPEITVSVLCHTYNHEAFIGNTLDGFLSQDAGFPVEIIVHDDASTDGTQDVVRAYQARYGERIRTLFQETNRFSTGIRPPHFTFPVARGEFLALCEGDDYWSDPGKLRKQVDAMRRHPTVDLCIHPATRLSMRTGRMKTAFLHGPQERVIGIEEVVGRRDQFAPTSSMLFRAEAARAMPEWFFNEPGMPVADFFLEAILGRSGTLYLPEVMSVYRRGVQESYTERFRHAPGDLLEDRLERMLHFVAKLRGVEGIPEEAVGRKEALVRLNYALQFLAAGDRERFVRVSRQITLPDAPLLQALFAATRGSRLLQWFGRQTFLALRNIKG